MDPGSAGVVWSALLHTAGGPAAESEGGLGNRRPILQATGRSGLTALGRDPRWYRPSVLARSVRDAEFWRSLREILAGAHHPPWNPGSDARVAAEFRLTGPPILSQRPCRTMLRSPPVLSPPVHIPRP